MDMDTIKAELKATRQSMGTTAAVACRERIEWLVARVEELEGNVSRLESAIEMAWAGVTRVLGNVGGHIGSRVVELAERAEAAEAECDRLAVENVALMQQREVK